MYVKAQLRWASGMSVSKAKHNMMVAEKSIFTKIPDVNMGKVPHTDMFYDEGKGLGPGHGVARERQVDTRMPYRKLMPVNHGDWDDRPMAVRRFQEMNMAPMVMTALQELEVVVPTVIQQTAMPLAIDGKSVAICAPTGMGKTVAFLAPVFHRMALDREKGVELRLNRPRAVVLAPTFELVHQLWSVASTFGRHCGMEVREHYGAQSRREREGEAYGLYDMLVTTPLGFRRLRDKGVFVDTDIKYLVFDEADVVMGGSQHKDSKAVDTETFMDNLKPLLLKQFERDSYLGRHKLQIITSSCSMTEAYSNRLSQWVPHYHPVTHQDSHTVPPNIRHRFYHVLNKEKTHHVKALLATVSVRRDRVWEATIERSKQNFWFPDAITFETGLWSPADQGSHLLAPAPGAPDAPDSYEKRFLPKDNRRTYKKEYAETEKLALTAPAPSLLPAGSGKGDALVPVGNDIMVQSVKDSYDNILVPEVSRPAVGWGAEKTVAAPMTGVPGLLPLRRRPKGARVMIFVDTVAEIKRLSKELSDEGYRVATFHALKGIYGHGGRVAEFEKWATGECNVLLTTDLAARGLDHPVDMIINYNIPAFPVDYVNRAGRTGRMGREGSVHSLVNRMKKAELRFAKVLESRLARHKPLVGVYAHPEAFRTTVNKWWKKKQKKLVDKWNKLQWLGFVTKGEEQKARHETLGKAFQIMPNPRGVMGKQSKSAVPKKKLNAIQNHLSWQLHVSTRGTGDQRNLDIKRVSKMMREGPSQIRHIAGSKNDLRRTYIWKPRTKDKNDAMIKRMGRYAIPTPLSTRASGRPAYPTMSKYPEQP